MTEYEFTLHLSAEEYFQYYAGVAKSIKVRSHCGKTIEFPAKKIRKFVLKNGIYGIFIMQLDNKNKLLTLKKIS